MLTSLYLTALAVAVPAAICVLLGIRAIAAYLSQRKYDVYNKKGRTQGIRITELIDYVNHQSSTYTVGVWRDPRKPDTYGWWEPIDRYYSATYDTTSDQVHCGCFRGSIDSFEKRIKRKERSQQALIYYGLKLTEFRTQDEKLKQQLSAQGIK